MGRSSETPAQKTRTLLRRRPSDFLGRGDVLMQGGCMCCCCCCCLHWIGAAAGGAVGIVGPLRADKRKRTPPVHPIARKYVVRATWISIVVVAVVTIPTGAGFALMFLPSLAFLPVGAGAMLGAALARKTEAWRIADPEERQRIAAGMGLAWRIAWKSFVWATFASGIGYLLMFLIGLAFDAF